MLYKNLFVIGLTGNIATGKSTVAHILEEEGASVIDTDQVARQVVEPYTPGWQLILNHFGWEMLLPDLTLNRKKLGKIVFSSSEKRTLLGKLLHPYIKEAVQKKLKGLSLKAGTNGHTLTVVLIIPLLFEAGYEKAVDAIWITVAQKETQLRRLMERDRLTEKEALDRINAQQDPQEKIPRSQVVIDTEEPLQETRNRVTSHFRKIQETLSTMETR